MTFSRTSADGEEGFPGKVEIQVTYSLSDADEVKYSVKATSDKPTPINITNHSNFNLAGQVKYSFMCSFVCPSIDWSTHPFVGPIRLSRYLSLER